MDFESTTRRIVWMAVAFEGGLALLALGLGWLPGVQSPLVRIKQLSEEFIREWFASCSVLQLGLISLLAGIGEEMLFRGVIQDTLSAWINPLAGIVLASLLFGLMHPITPFYVVLAALMGAFLGWIFIVTDNLLPAIITHGLYDFLALTYLTRVASR